ncbi:MAG: carboxypeptidase regulatory-like domain-containing protein [Chloroflexaceae bacterium]|nr:carboxypeptidase regulatory-like domain-containing protein [Chloroflexaceae bacterium]
MEEAHNHPLSPAHPPCQFDEETLLDYLEDRVSDNLRATIESTPDCLARVHQLRRTIARIEQMLYRCTCPDVETLLDYQEHRLSGTDYLIIHAHVTGCPHCQAEITTMNAMDEVEVPLMPAPPFAAVQQGIRRLVEAVARPKTALGVLGSSVIYESPHLHMDLSTERMTGAMRNWMLTGDVRTPERLPAGSLVEAVQVQRIDQPDQPPIAATLDEDGSFVIAGLRSGVYRLHLLTTREEIVIRELHIGEAV